MSSMTSQKVRVADYIMQKLADEGVRHLFLVTGGGAMHLNDAIGREKRLEYVCNHHEQASAIAAEGYARVAEKLGVINVTTGPGGINALNGVFGAYTDSAPMLVISGQTKRETCMAAYPELRLRQLGDQEVDIVAMVRPITKYAQLVMDPTKIRYELEKAMHLAQTGRPGPCWIDIPVDVQGAMVDPGLLEGYTPEEGRVESSKQEIRQMCAGLVAKLKAAKRPVLLIGTGVRIAKGLDALDVAARKLGIPIATAWTPDLLPTDDPYYCGRQGTIGTRAGNFTVQNADLVIIVGSRMAIRQISYNWQAFARCAYKVQVDIDPAELNKPTFKADESLCCDAREFLVQLSEELGRQKFDAEQHREWLGWCKERVRKYPTVLPKHRTTEHGVNSYYFVEKLFQKLDSRDVVVSGDATACIVPFQAAEIKKGQRLFSNSGSASMGYDLPAAIGAAYAVPGQRVICLAGDGSIMMNIQELATVAKNGLNLKIFVLNNGGYLSIRSTQANFFKLLVGEGPESGVGFPDFVKLAEAHGIPAMRVEGEKFGDLIDKALEKPGPYLCEVILDRSQGFEPKLSSKRLPDGRMVTAPLEDMAPFLEREELLSNLLIPAME